MLCSYACRTLQFTSHRYLQLTNFVTLNVMLPIILVSLCVYRENTEVLDKFVGMHEFHGLDLVTALRSFMGSFQLCGEGQQMERMMKSFAKRYCECQASSTGSHSYSILYRTSIILIIQLPLVHMFCSHMGTFNASLSHCVHQAADVCL